MVITLEAPTTIAYFSMEVGINQAMPTYGGGLGVLAGDTLRAAADMGLPMVGVTLLHRKGYTRQRLDSQGNQIDGPHTWPIEEYLERMPQRVAVSIEGRQVMVGVWRDMIDGASGHSIPLYFLDTLQPENSEWDQTLTDRLYGAEQRYRICQEAALALGGAAMLKALGHTEIGTYHMNEGHSAFLTLALLEEQTAERGIRRATTEDVDAVRRRCVFTTHTPVPAGHDRFPMSLVRHTLGDEKTWALDRIGCFENGVLNMTHLALYFSRYVNGVSMRHEYVSRSMFPEYPIKSITNGVHALTWTSEPFRRLFDEHIPTWQQDNEYLRYAVDIPLEKIQQAHLEAKQALIELIERRNGAKLDPDVLTIGFARRAVEYKRADLLFSDIERLKAIAESAGRMQVIYAGKAHPNDGGGKALIRRIFEAAAPLRDIIPIVYIENYDIEVAKYLCPGVDLWLNTPQKPYEASGTSGMKAALNGVPSLSILDGWWVEGHVEGVTGWSIGDNQDMESNREKEVASLYDKLENVILPMYYERPLAYAEVRRYAIALNGSFFNTQRMVRQYLENAYLTPVSAR
ncbi:MAG: alpha-glucan family phosphorylase [Chloroflexi bacterium]|nr:alpha-glucan family phosphorylase [Chloroflexota bacterium]